MAYRIDAYGVQVREQLAVAECREPGRKARIDKEQADFAPLGLAGCLGHQRVDGPGLVGGLPGLKAKSGTAQLSAKSRSA